MKKEKKKKLPLLEQFRHLREYLQLAGIKLHPNQVFTILYVLSAFVDLSVLFYLYYIFAQYETVTWVFILFLAIFVLTFIYFLIFMVMWLFFLLMLDYMKFKRKSALEDVLPEFLRLVAANHRAGISLDMSIWKANRPRFGILAQEIDEMARSSYASGDIINPLQQFAAKYDSTMLKRVISNLIEGLKTGADISSLLDDISTNITTIKNTRKELASEVENYMLFITITVLVISPLMFGLTNKMSSLIESVKTTLGGTFQEGEGPAAQMPIVIPSGEDTGVSFKLYFDIFVYLMIATNSTVSVLLMSMVKYGNVRQELKRVPVYFIVAIIVYGISKYVFNNFLTI